jgi:hypothetical protein
LTFGVRVAGRVGIEQGDAIAGGDLVEDVVVLAEEGVRGAGMDEAENPRLSADEGAGVAVGTVSEYGERSCGR